MNESTNQTAMLIISAIVILGFGGVVIAWLMNPPAADQSNILAGMMGVLGSGYMLVMNYWFGPSRKNGG
jgi:CHASE2 domain-containing sensor protein